jgi:hypothetical protein
LTISTALIAALYCGLFFYFIEKASIRVPVYDLLDWLRFYSEQMQANDWLAYLWAPHNEHRIVFSRILLVIDERWLGGQGMAFAALAAMSVDSSKEDSSSKKRGRFPQDVPGRDK